MKTTRRAFFLRCVLDQMGSPYIWNAKGHFEGESRAFDCSGLVTWAQHFLGGPDWRRTHNTDTMLLKLPAVATPRPGDLAMYGPSKQDANHVMIFLGEGVVMGASGGGRQTTTLDIAKASAARVKPKASFLYRPDFLGWRVLPWLDEGDTSEEVTR